MDTRSMSASSSADNAVNPLTTARMEELDDVETDVIAILESAGRDLTQYTL